ncbi:AI-2E family transporter [Aurantivibrio plasticivorans]
MSAEKIERRAFLGALIGITLLFGALMLPFFAPILWACIIAILFHPMQCWLVGKWGKRPNVTALVTLMVCIVLVIIPVLFLGFTFIQQGVDLYQKLKEGDVNPAEYVDQVRAAFPAIESLLQRFDIDINALRQGASKAALAAGQFLAGNALAVGQGTFQFFLSFCIMLYVAFFLLRDGNELIEMLIHYLPIGDERERLLFQKFSEVSKATVKGNLVIAIVQGALGGIIFWVLDLPPALLWGVVMAVLSLIPAVGAGLVWLPAAIYLYAVGEVMSGTVLVLFGIFVIGLVDNVLRPILVGKDTKLPDWMVLLSTLSGLTLFGMNGFVVGPIIAMLFIAFWQIFGREFGVHADGPIEDALADERESE